MMYTPPRSTFHHVCFYGAVGPVASVLVHVAVFLSIALLALIFKKNDTNWDQGISGFRRLVLERIYHLLKRQICAFSKVLLIKPPLKMALPFLNFNEKKIMKAILSETMFLFINIA